MTNRSITPSQRNVLLLVADGKSNAEIGAYLFVTEDTVKSHMRHIMKALGARNRAHAVHIAHQHGILGAAPAVEGDPVPLPEAPASTRANSSPTVARFRRVGLILHAV